MELNDRYWTDRYQNKETSWDVGDVSTPIKEYIDQLNNKNIRILIPGCGNAYEAEYLVEKGFADITLIDISEVKSRDLTNKFKKYPGVKILHGDFFKHVGNYDLIIEQTFFCAIDPSLREAYIEKMHSLLTDGGKLTGVLFDRDFTGGPPFGGSKKEYDQLFGKLFNIRTMDPCYNSISPRKNTELFFIVSKNRADK
jgi:SAM-dependent methyltransferase